MTDLIKGIFFGAILIVGAILIASIYAEFLHPSFQSEPDYTKALLACKKNSTSYEYALPEGIDENFALLCASSGGCVSTETNCKKKMFYRKEAEPKILFWISRNFSSCIETKEAPACICPFLTPYWEESKGCSR